MHSGHAADLWQVAHPGPVVLRPELWPLIISLWRWWGVCGRCWSTSMLLGTPVNWQDRPLGPTPLSVLQPPSTFPSSSTLHHSEVKWRCCQGYLAAERGGVRWYRWDGLLSVCAVDVKEKMWRRVLEYLGILWRAKWNNGSIQCMRNPKYICVCVCVSKKNRS